MLADNFSTQLLTIFRGNKPFLVFLGEVEINSGISRGVKAFSLYFWGVMVKLTKNVYEMVRNRP